ncbi:MAG: hypothetical protein OEV49_03465 [candidate division Zixibacteria bacterium]|nr:hypothetical protein [candidate division Zixibacteria bacterium]MDH3939267.1 hypothetical protein [candidate division Zixibacteria bacterium]MDH4034689.1 hypothetical protein [candidate division Zixibacteria bacterium]
MKTYWYKYRSVVAFFCVLATFAVGKAQIAVIANTSVPIESLDKEMLFDVYRCDVQTWDDDTKIMVWDLGERGATRKAFYEFIGKRPSRMKSLWMKKLLTGDGDPPEVAESEEEMLEKIIGTPGAIGYVNQELVDDRVKLLLVIEEE